jgi:hypothetical protein
LGYYFTANDLTLDEDREKRKAILLSVCGGPTYDLMKNLVQPESIVVKTYDGLVEVVKKHYEPVIVQRYKFNTRSRGQDESVAAYVAALKALGGHCEFHSK